MYISKGSPSTSKIHEDEPRYTKYQAAAGRPRPRGATGSGGPAAAWYFVYLGTSSYILSTFLATIL